MSALKASPIALARLRRDRTRLIRAGVIALGVIGIGGAVAFGGDYFLTARTDTKQKIDAERSGLTGRISQMQSDAKESSTAIKLYGLLMRVNGQSESGNVDFSLNREELAARLAELRTKHMLQDLQLSAQAPQPVAQSPAQLKDGKEVSMQVELTIKAWSDVHVSEFIRDIKTSLPGYVDIQELNMQRDGLITPEILATAAQRGRVPLVTAKVRFIWRGVQSNPKIAPAVTIPGAPTPLPGGMAPGAPHASLLSFMRVA